MLAKARKSPEREARARPFVGQAQEMNFELKDLYDQTSVMGIRLLNFRGVYVTLNISKVK